MKCRANTYKYQSGPCTNTGAVDGYCYLHHPEVLLAKFRFQLRANRPGTWNMTPDQLTVEIEKQKTLLAEIAAQPVILTPRMEAALAAMPVPTGQLPV